MNTIKTRLFVLTAALALILTGCSSDQASSQAKSSPADCYKAIQDALDDSDSFKVTYDEAANKIAIISTTEHLDTYIALARLGDNWDEEWQDTVDAMVHLASSARNICVDRGCESTTVTLDVVSNKDSSISYLTIVNGEITYNAYAAAAVSRTASDAADLSGVNLRAFVNVCEATSISARSVGSRIEVYILSYFSPDVRPDNWNDICARLTDALDNATVDEAGPAISAQILAKDQTILATAYRGKIGYDYYPAPADETHPATQTRTSSGSGQASAIVFVTPTGDRYHRLASCAGSNAKAVHLSDVHGLTPCQKCW